MSSPGPHLSALTSDEAVSAASHFLRALFGSDQYRRWTLLKANMRFARETDLVDWLLDLADKHHHYHDNASGDVSNNFDDIKPNILTPDTTADKSDARGYIPVDDNCDYNDTDRTLGSNFVHGQSNNFIKCEQLEEEEDEGNEEQQRAIIDYDIHYTGEIVSERGNCDGYNFSRPFPEVTLLDEQEEDEDNCCVIPSLSDEHSDLAASTPHTDTPTTTRHRPNATAPGPYHVVDAARGVTPLAYSCEYCGRGFAWRNDLKRHVTSVHLGVKPHGCPVCPFRCSLRFNLRKHVRSRHGRHLDP